MTAKSTDAIAIIQKAHNDGDLVSDAHYGDIESLHLVELDQRFQLDLFPLEQVYGPYEVNDGVTTYLLPMTSFQNYQYFRSVKKLSLRASLRRRYGARIASRVMKRYLSFEYEFYSICFGNRVHCMIATDKQAARFWTEDLVELAFLMTKQRVDCSARQQLLVDSKIQKKANQVEWLVRNSDVRSKRKENCLWQFRFYESLRREFPTNWDYDSYAIEYEEAIADGGSVG